jgi:hypothetical protein
VAVSPIESATTALIAARLEYERLAAFTASRPVEVKEALKLIASVTGETVVSVGHICREGFERLAVMFPSLRREITSSGYEMLTGDVEGIYLLAQTNAPTAASEAPHAA